jgi:hypothetical protein
MRLSGVCCPSTSERFRRLNTIQDAVVPEAECHLRAEKLELYTHLRSAIDERGVDITENVLWVRVPEYKDPLDPTKKTSILPIIIIIVDGVGHIRTYGNRSAGQTFSVAVFACQPGVEAAKDAVIIDYAHSNSLCEICARKCEEVAKLASEWNGEYCLWQKNGSLVHFDGEPECTANTAGLAAQAEPALVEKLSTRIVAGRDGREEYPARALPAHEAEVPIPFYIAGVTSDQDSAIHKKTKLGVRAGLEELLGEASAAVNAIEKLVPVRHCPDLSHLNKNSKKLFIELLAGKEAKEAGIVDGSAADLLIALYTAVVKDLRSVVATARERVTYNADGDVVVDPLKSPVVEAKYRESVRKLDGVVDHINGSYLDHRTCYEDICEIREGMLRFDTEKPDASSVERNATAKQLTELYVARKIAEKKSAALPGMSLAERNKLTFSFLGLGLCSNKLVRMKSRFKSLSTREILLHCASMMKGSTMVESFFNLISLYSLGKRIHWGRKRRNYLWLAISIYRFGHGMRSLVELFEKLFSFEYPEFTMKHAVSLDTRRENDRVRKSTVEYQSRKRMSKVMRQRISKQRSLNDREGSYLGSEGANRNATTRRKAAEGAPKTIGRAKKCPQCLTMHAKGNPLCGVAPNARNVLQGKTRQNMPVRVEPANNTLWS